MSFNPRSPCGERLRRAFADAAQQEVSTHAPRVGSDFVALSQMQRSKKFQPTLPVWGATVAVVSRFLGRDVSTHAPRVGSDCYIL